MSQVPEYTLHLGDCLDVLRTLPDSSIDSVVTDPPYGLNFMGKKWDYDVPGTEIWAECLRVLKPGGHLLAFAGTRTQHRMAVRIEDAGFEIRDMIAWVYGSGFPKSHNLTGGHKGWGTALKPALETVTVARKPFKGPVAENVLIHGTGALNIDGCRVGSAGETAKGSKPEGAGNGLYGAGLHGACEIKQLDAGRWPANLIHDGSDEVLAEFPNAPGQQGDLKGHSKDRLSKNAYGDMKAARDAIARGDTGSAARFFYCPKVSRKERNEGLEGAELTGNNHPTVKPVELMAYLCRLVTPPDGVVLDPFMGSGSTGKAALREGFDFVGIERDAAYFALAEKRIAHEHRKRLPPLPGAVKV